MLFTASSFGRWSLRLFFATLLVCCQSVADDLCGWTGDTHACPTPFPPGYENIGSSWWLIGIPFENITVKSMNASLHMPSAPVPVNNVGFAVINPSWEGAVRGFAIDPDALS